MNKRISKEMEQSSHGLSLNNGIMNSQSNWSRCDSFSSSSSDSTLYCSNSPQHSSFSGKKRLKTEEPITKKVKRSRNSSGSSASSNLSCVSDKDINQMSPLLSSEQVSHGMESMKNLGDISPSNLALQHEVMLNNRLSHPLAMNAALPFRHNLRRNIRKKTCSCDCTTTCTTVVVSRQYKGIDKQTVEEKTVISHTKMKTFVESNTSQSPIKKVQMSSKVSVQENVAHENECSNTENGTLKNECNKKRRSEIERLYDSLQEMKWPKDFSPVKVLQQFDLSKIAQTPNSKVQMLSKVSFQENLSHKKERSIQCKEARKNEINGEGDTELEKVHDSVHKTKGTENVSQDENVEQTDVNNTIPTPNRQVQMSSKILLQENVTLENECSFLENATHNKESSLQENATFRSECSFQENATPKNECNRKRRTEMEKLYDSLHEIKWAKNFSPDNILRQFDVRQAASCSAFGKASEEKPAKSDKRVKKCPEVSDTQTANKSPSSIKVNKSTRYLSYTTRSKIRSSLRSSGRSVKKENSNPPVLEKTIITADEALNINSPHYNTFPVLSKEILTSDEEIKTKNLDLSSSCSSVETDYATCRSFPEATLNIDLNSHCNIDSQLPNVTGCSSTFFNIAEDNIHTIDACFREVGAEVVVSTCCDSEYDNLPLLTAMKEMHSSNIKSISHEYPPVLKPLEPLLQQCESSFDCPLGNFDSTSGSEDSRLVEPHRKFFPQVNPLCISVEDYSPPFSFLPKTKNNNAVDEDNDDKHYADNSEEKTDTIQKNDEETDPVSDIQSKSIVDYNLEFNPGVSSLMCDDETETLQQSIICEPGPPVLERCSSNEACCVSVSENIISEKRSNFSDDACDKKNGLANRTNSFSRKPKLLNWLHKSSKTGFRSKPFITSGRAILKKYNRFFNSNFKRRSKISKICNRSLNNSVVSQKASPTSNTFCNGENVITNDSSLSVGSLSFPDCAQMTHAKISNSSMFISSSPSQTTEITKNCISSCESCLQSTETVTDEESTTVIRNFNQKLSFSTSQENVTLNQITNSSISIQNEKKPCLNNKKAKKSSLNIFNNQYSENFADIPGYSKILLAAKKKEGHAHEKIKVPPRIFTCHFQTLNVTRGNDYIQIVLKITRGKSIFLTQETLVELKEAIIKAGNDKDCRLLILNGFGQTFCLGLDLRPLIGDHKNQAVGDIANAVKDLIGTLADFQKPLVAIVNGAAYGLGLTILNHADITLATSNASFCMPYSRLGYMPEGGATLTLPQAVGTTVAMDLILRGQVITAEQARDIGLVNEVVEVQHLPQDLVTRVQAMAQNSLPGMEATKAMIKMRLHIQLPLVLETEAKLLPQMWLSPGCQEAILSALNSGFFEDC